MIIYIYTNNMMSGLSDKEKAEKAKQKLENYYNMKIMKKVDHMLSVKVKNIIEYFEH